MQKLWTIHGENIAFVAIASLTKARKGPRRTLKKVISKWVGEPDYVVICRSNIVHQGLLNVLAAPNTTDEGKMFMEGLQVKNIINEYSKQ